MSGDDLRTSTIGYFVSTSVDDYVYIGGAMVTDNHGLPLEFRYTEPIRANRLQRILYGDVLERYIHADVILTSLLERFEQKPDLFVVNDGSFLSSIGRNGATGVWLGETRLTGFGAVGETQDVSSEEFLLQLADAGSPTRVKTTIGLTEAHNRSAICNDLVEFSHTMQLLEPLRRIEEAIRLIWDESDENPLQPIIDVR